MSIQVSGLVKRYSDVTVVHDVSLEIGDGEFVSILGPSGCGKTTTLRCIAGLEEAQGGEIRIGDHLVMSSEKGIQVPANERHVGMVFQSYAVWPHMSVAENVAFPLRSRGVPRGEIERGVSAALDVVALASLRDRYPSQLSGGQQQRVALARAIVGSPRVLLFDEPLSNLDAKLRESTRAEIRRLQRRLGIAALYVTHDQDEALSMSDKVVVMNGGHVQQVGTPRELYREPANRFVAGFVGRASFVEAQAASGGWTTPDGTPVRLSACPPGARGALMLRPESIAIRPAEGNPGPFGGDPGPAGPAGLNQLPGRIVRADFLGAHCECEVEAAGWSLKAYAQSDLEPGTEVVVSFPPDAPRPVGD